MSTGQYDLFANRLIQILKEKGHASSRSPNGICVKTLAEFVGASEQICRRYLRGDALPEYAKVKQLSEHLNVSPGWLLFGDNDKCEKPQNNVEENLLHYILKKSHHLYQSSRTHNNDEYADFVLELINEVRNIDTSENNLLKIIDLALGSISSYEEKRGKQSHAI